MENIFIKQTKVKVKKVTEISDGWLLYPIDDADEPVFISNQYYVGKMPPFFRFPWQKFTLLFTSIDNFILSAQINNKILFTMSEDNLPPNVKSKLNAGRKIAQEIKEQNDEIDNKIKIALEEYLSVIEVKSLLEDEMKDLHICFRAYLKLHWQKGKICSASKERLSLAIFLCQAAQKMCQRHFALDSCIVLFLPFTTSARFQDDYRMDIEALSKINSDMVNVFSDYYEIDELLSYFLPKVENRLLKRYLVYVVENLCSLFIYDYSGFMSKVNYSIMTGQRTNTDLEVYRSCKNIKMPYFSNFILPDKFDETVAKNFFYSCSL